MALITRQLISPFLLESSAETPRALFTPKYVRILNFKKTLDLLDFFRFFGFFQFFFYFFGFFFRFFSDFLDFLGFFFRFFRIFRILSDFLDLS